MFLFGTGAPGGENDELPQGESAPGQLAWNAEDEWDLASPRVRESASQRHVTIQARVILHAAKNLSI